MAVLSSKKVKIHQVKNHPAQLMVQTDTINNKKRSGASRPFQVPFSYDLNNRKPFKITKIVLPS